MEGFEFYPRGYRAVYAWLRNENLALIGVNWTGKDFSAVRADIEGHYLLPSQIERVPPSTLKMKGLGSLDVARPGFTVILVSVPVVRRQSPRVDGEGWASFLSCLLLSLCHSVAHRLLD
jgi:hypothetical protein